MHLLHDVSLQVESRQRMELFERARLQRANVVLRKVEEGQAGQLLDRGRHSLETATLEIQILEGGLQSAHGVLVQRKVVVRHL